MCCITVVSIAQNIEKKPKIDENRKISSATKSQEFSVELSGETNTISADLKWLPILTNKCIGRSHISPNQDFIKELKKNKTIEKQNATLNKNGMSENSVNFVTPVVGNNFLGNTNNNNSPMDNSIAISNNGWIVSVANTTIKFCNTTGTTTYVNDIPTFFNDNTITNVCDPVALYDAGSDRFIFFAQECAANSSNSYILICFSKTNNPNDGFWKYKVTGNPLNNNTWFDYPKLAVSTNELYISGNLYTNSDPGTFNQSVLYQIPKANGYNGGSLPWQVWSNIAGSPFTLLPVSHGQGQSYGPGCYLISTSAGGASTINLYDLTDDMSATNEQLNYYSISTTAYTPAGDAAQLGTNCLLDNGACRALSGFYLNGTVHFVFHSDFGGAWNGINYNRLNISTLSNQSSLFGITGKDYSYPSVVSYSNSLTDKSVMIGYGASNSSVYPEIRVVNCDDAMNWSGSILVKPSTSYVSYTSTTKERWGDYTGTSRKHNSTNPSIWMNGMYGDSSHKWNTWIAEIHDNQLGINDNTFNNDSFKIYPNPIVDNFYVDFILNNNSKLDIEIIDINGKLVQQLFKGNVNSGNINFSFNKANLSSGMYFLVIKDNSIIIKNEKIIIN
jgi:hypothetical protein